MLKKIWGWLVKSSANPQKISLAVKGFLGLVVSFLIFIGPVTNWQPGQDQLQQAADLIVQMVVAAAGIISAIATIIGLIRKVMLTFKKN